MPPTIFLAYAFRFPQVRAAVADAASGLADVTDAGDEITDLQLLDKIENQLRVADLCLFDLTAHNVNVAVEYGLARGLGLNRALLYNEDERLAPDGRRDVFTDLQGRDSIRYPNFSELATRLRPHLPNLLSRPRGGASAGVPRLQAELAATTNPNSTFWFIGRLWNASDVPVTRVSYALAGYLPPQGPHATRGARIGSLVRNQEFSLRLRYDDLYMVKQPLGTEHLLVEYVDDRGRRYEQRGRLIAHRTESGYAYVFDGLDGAKPIERLSLPTIGLEDA